MAELPKLVAHAKKRAPGFAGSWGCGSFKVQVRAPWRSFPLPGKAILPRCRRLPAARRPERDAGGEAGKLFISPGPIYDPEGRGKDWWRTARGLFAGGFRAGDRVLNTFAYHFTPAGSMLESGATAIGCTVIPGGVGQTEMQVAAIRDLR